MITLKLLIKCGEANFSLKARQNVTLLDQRNNENFGHKMFGKLFRSYTPPPLKKRKKCLTKEIFIIGEIARNLIKKSYTFFVVL